MYKTWFTIEKPVGNNEFSYKERIDLWSAGKIFVPSLIQWSIADLEEGSEICFEEIVDNKLISCTWLKHFIKTSLFGKEGEGDSGIPTYIFDNHNHALFFRYQHTKQFESAKPFVVLHIDQHSDIKENENRIGEHENIVAFVNEKTNVGNFITAGLKNNIIDEVIQIRSNYALQQLWAWSFKLWANYILDIDMDFREQKTDKEIESDFTIIRKLLDNVCLITIATSPYFMNQKKAIEIIKRLLQ